MHELGDILKDMSVKLARNTKLLVEAIDQSKLTNCTVDEFNRVTRSNKKSVVSRIVERKKEWDGQLVNGQMDMSQ